VMQIDHDRFNEERDKAENVETGEELRTEHGPVRVTRDN